MDNNAAKKLILILWDFSPSSEIALQHAIQLGNVGNDELMLLHLIPRGGLLGSLLASNTDAETLTDLNRRLQDTAGEIQTKHGFTPHTMVIEGSPKKELTNLVLNHNINLIVAHHTYSTKGKTYRTSDWLRSLVFKDITLPFIIANKAPAHSHYIEIAIPIYQDQSFKEAVQWIIQLSQYYHCNVNFIKPFITEDLKKKQLASNVYFTKKMLDGVGIIYGMKTAKKNTKFEDEVFRFADNIDADLIMVMSDKYGQLLDEAREKALHIPVMCVNTRIKKYQSFN